MKKSLKLLFAVLFLLIIVGGCNIDTPDNEIIKNDTEESQDEGTANNTDEEVEDNNIADSEDDESSNSSSHNSSGNEDILGLGDTGVMETALGNYEITPLSPR